MAGDTVSVCLHAFVSVFVASRWWEWTHMPWQRGHRNPQTPPKIPKHQPPPPSPLCSIKGHTWPLTPLESILIGRKCSQWPSRNNAQWSSERKRREGRRGGENLYLWSLPPYKPRSWAVSQQARNKRGAYFSIWGTKGIGHGGETIQPLNKKKKQQVGLRLLSEERRSIRESFIHAGRQQEIETLEQEGEGVILKEETGK